MLKRYIGDLFLSLRWYLLMAGAVVCFLVAFFVPLVMTFAWLYLTCILLLTVVDYALLFFVKGSIQGTRLLPHRMSLGDDNTVTLSLLNSRPYTAHLSLIDELPFQFQERKFSRHSSVNYRGRQTVTYTLRPTERGEFAFGRLLAYIKTPLQLLMRRELVAEADTVKVYPAFLHLKRYQLMAASTTAFTGAKKVRRNGLSLEFEKIKEYVAGDDVRTINWKATARRGDIMVNTYTDARQQQIYCVIDKGRAMKMPFDGLTLLDYSINASLALLNVALLRQDRAGLVTFAQKVTDTVPAERRNGQINLLMEALYKQQTDFKDSDYENLSTTLRHKLNQRSFLLLFTNFETLSALERQLPYLRILATRHLLCVVFFQNTLLKEIHESKPDTIEDIYIKTIADRFDYEKRQIVKELRRHGILSLLTTPQGLSVDVVNQYLELKARQMI